MLAGLIICFVSIGHAPSVGFPSELQDFEFTENNGLTTEQDRRDFCEAVTEIPSNGKLESTEVYSLVPSSDQ